MLELILLNCRLCYLPYLNIDKWSTWSLSLCVIIIMLLMKLVMVMVMVSMMMTLWIISIFNVCTFINYVYLQTLRDNIIHARGWKLSKTDAISSNPNLHRTNLETNKDSWKNGNTEINIVRSQEGFCPLIIIIKSILLGLILHFHKKKSFMVLFYTVSLPWSNIPSYYMILSFFLYFY